MKSKISVAYLAIALAACGGSEGQAPPPQIIATPTPTPTPTPSPSPSPTPTGNLGLFVLSSVGTAASNSTLANPSLAGIVVRQQWSDISPSSAIAGNDYSFLQSEANRAQVAGKKMSLIVSWAGDAAPEWLRDRGVTYFDFLNPNEFQPDGGEIVSSPATWDPDYTREVTALIADLGSKLADNSALSVVNTHCVSASSPDWFLPIDSESNIAALKAAGFTNDGLLESCRQIIDATMTAFPSQIVTMAFGQLPQSLTGVTEGDFIARQIIDHIRTRWPDRTFLAMRWNLGATSPDPRVSASLGQGWGLIFEQHTNATDRILPAAQWVWPASDTDSCRANGKIKPCTALTNFVTAGDIATLGYSMPYLEVYGADVSNPDLADAIVKLAQQVPSIQ